MENVFTDTLRRLFCYILIVMYANMKYIVGNMIFYS